jgi:transposase
MTKERRHFTAQQKVAILRRHLVDKVPVSEVCEENGLQPSVFYRWQKELLEKGAVVFRYHSPGQQRGQSKRLHRDRIPAYVGMVRKVPQV